MEIVAFITGILICVAALVLAYHTGRKKGYEKGHRHGLINSDVGDAFKTGYEEGYEAGAADAIVHLTLTKHVRPPLKQGVTSNG